MKTYKFRLYPSRRQIEVLNRTFDRCRFTYNQLLEQMNNSQKISRKEIQHYILELKKQYPELNNTYSKTLQYENYRLFSNLSALRELKKKGRKVGRLRFKGKEWFKTINYNQSGYKLIKTAKRYDKLHLSKVGDIQIRCHREVKGKIKQITIKKSANKWYALLITDEEYKLQKGTKQLGIDFGIISFVTDSEGNKISNPLFLNKSLNRLKKAQKELSRKKKGSENRTKVKLRLIKVYEKIKNQKIDFFHKLTTKLVNNCSLIVIENLDIKSVMLKSYNARNISDSSWGKFISMLKSKAESAGCLVVEVNPKNTTKTCNKCSNIQEIPLYKRTYKCKKCGLEIDRDYNSAKNILNKFIGLEQSFAETKPLLSNEQVLSMKQEALSKKLE